MEASTDTTLDETRAIALLEQVRQRGGNRHLAPTSKTRMLHGAVSLGARLYGDTILRTNKVDISGAIPLFEHMLSGKGTVLCCWHAKIVSIALAFRHAFGRGLCNHRIRAMISESRDGELIARVFRDLGGNCVRGSSSRRGLGAIREAVRELQSGTSVTFTPDGPRGPRHVIQDGVLEAALLSGAPIFPVSGSFSRNARFVRSWDRFELPLPFGRFRFYAGPPLYPERENRDKEALRRELALRMRQVERRANNDEQRTVELGKPREPKPSQDRGAGTI